MREENNMQENKLKVCVLYDWHPFDPIEFNNVLNSMDEIEFYPTLFETFLYDYAGNMDQFDGLLFYNMTLGTPPPDEWNPNGRKKAADTLYRIGESGQGIVVLHHAILSHPDWSGWSDLVGISNRKFDYFPNTEISIHVNEQENPITKGISDWTMIDETFLLDSCGDDSQILLSTKSEKSLKSIAWTRTYKNSNVFCFQSGHDKTAFTNSNFRTVLNNGILWSCKSL